MLDLIEILARAKRSSLFYPTMNGEEKCFMTIVPEPKHTKGSAISNKIEPTSCLDQIINFKIARFA